MFDSKDRAAGPAAGTGARPGQSLAQLVEVMDRLLAPDGCPWDREQTLETLQPYLVEETYEVLEAIAAGDPAEHCEELGDLLLQIVFQAALRQRDGEFAIDDVVASITSKLVRRHPHVFGEADASTADEVLEQWEEIKAREKRAKRAAGDGGDDRPARTLGGVPVAMPALSRAQTLGEKAARVGFDGPDAESFAAKVIEELGELREAAARGSDDDVAHEVGDLLFSVVNLARKLGCDAEAALRAANRRFCDRFAHVEDRLAERGQDPGQASAAEMDALWDEAKRRVTSS